MDISKIVRTVAIVATNLVIAGGIVYAYESNKSVESIYQYYGNVTTTRAFYYPDRIAAMTFGVSHAGDLHLDFINRLLCAPEGTTVEPELIDVRSSSYDSYDFPNHLPKGSVKAVNKHSTISNIGLFQAEEIRRGSYSTWDMGTTIPPVSSNCYIETEATAYTKVFKLPKVTRFDGNWFAYHMNEKPLDAPDPVYKALPTDGLEVSPMELVK